MNFRTQALADVIADGGVVACPAEGVWGLSCDPESYRGVAQVLNLKDRSVDKGLIVVAADAEMFAPLLAGLTREQRQQVLASWPGPNTWLVPNRDVMPPWITGGSSEVAIRVTSAPALVRLSLATGGPLVSTSANPAGALPARWGFQVVRYFGPDLPRAVGQVNPNGKPSTIRRVQTGETVRV